MQKKAFSVLFCIFVLTFLTLLVFTCWYRTSLLLDLVDQREVFYKNFYLNNIFLKYSLVLAKENYDYFNQELDKTKKNIVFNLNKLLNFLDNNKNNSYKEDIILLINKNNSNNLIITVNLFHDNKLLSSQACLLERVKEQIDNGKEKISFNTGYFTINNNV